MLLRCGEKISRTGAGGRQGCWYADLPLDRCAEGLRAAGDWLFALSPAVPAWLGDLLDFAPPFVDFFALGAAFRLPFFCVHFITVSASVSNSAVIWSRVLPAQTASRIFLHDGLLDDAACNAVGFDAQTMNPATTNVRYRIGWSLSPNPAEREPTTKKMKNRKPTTRNGNPAKGPVSGSQFPVSGFAFSFPFSPNLCRTKLKRVARL
jgi:hypothetical protein